MDEKLSYKEFLDRNDSWPMDDRDLRFESQPVFKPMEMAGTTAAPVVVCPQRVLPSLPKGGFVLSPRTRARALQNALPCFLELHNILRPELPWPMEPWRAPERSQAG